MLVDPGPQSCEATLLGALGGERPRALLLTHTTPVIASAAMALSSLSVVANALRLRRFAGWGWRYLVHHRHTAAECGVVFAAFKGHASPLRRAATISSCPSGGHEIRWVVDAARAESALAPLPAYVAQRSSAVPVREVLIP